MPGTVHNVGTKTKGKKKVMFFALWELKADINQNTA